LSAHHRNGITTPCAELVITNAPIHARTRSASVTNIRTDQPEIAYKRLKNQPQENSLNL